MPMWISWINPRTQERERIYNYFGEDTPPGRIAINLAKRQLAEKFGIPEGSIPGFKVEWAEWKVPNPLRDLGDLLGP